ncbi:DNA-binding protein [Rossellomorea marisflavi]|uniref:DNA-binding protein n=1 Tax=Rossellomorea marisflavi TaxID=189381 RepID=UPI003F9FFCB7
MGHKRWTDSEIDYLKENVGYRRVADIAQTLNRTETAVMLKFKRLGIGKTKNVAGRVTCGELASLFSIDRNTVKSWVNKHGLPANRKVTSLKMRYNLISPEEFWEWAYHNRERMDFQKLEKNALPPEPEWVASERMNPTYKKRQYRDWTTNEDTLLASYIDQGLSYREIGIRLNRTELSVSKRYSRIKELKDYYKGNKPYAIKKGERLSLRKDKDDE